MKTKIFLILSLFGGVCCFTACDDDDADYKASSTAVVNSVTTGSADVTANSATVHGTVSGSLDKMSTSSYSVGFYYGTSEDDMSSAIIGTYESGNITAEITGLMNNTVLYYKAYVCLQNISYVYGKTKTLTTTDAKVATVAAKSVTSAVAVMGGTLTDYPADATCGVVMSTSKDEETVRAGLMVKADELSGTFEIDREGLLPNTTYYYAAYLDLGAGVIYGSVESFKTESDELDSDEDFVNLGLSVNWMKFNLGARNKNEYDLGGLFAYGDLTGLNNSIEASDYASEDIVATGNDILKKVYGGSVQLPTAENFEELFTVCTQEWKEVDGVYGCEFTGPNKNTLFLPAAGSRSANDVTEVGEMGYYLTGNINPSNSQFALSYQCGDDVATKTTTATYQALSVRGVSDPNPYEVTICFSNGSAWSDGEEGYIGGVIEKISANNIEGTFTSILKGSYDGTGVVLTFEIPRLVSDYPNSFVRIDDIKLDGTSIPYDANKFYYGDTENNGTYRVQFANIWGRGSDDSKTPDPFNGNDELVSAISEITFSESIEFTYTIFKELPSVFTPALITINPSWGGTWGFDQGATFSVYDSETCQFDFNQSTFDIKYENVDMDGTQYDHSGGSIMTFIQVDNMASYFPQMHSVLNEIKLDGNTVSNVDLTKVIDAEDANNDTGLTNYRLELWNMYGATSNEEIGCAFGTPDENGVISELAFSSSMELNFTFNSLFATPNWNE